MPSQHIDLSLLSASAAAVAAANKRDAIHHAAGYHTNLRHHRRLRRRQKTSQSRGSANCPATGHRCGLHRHSRERVILRNYCSGSPRRNAWPAGRAGVVQSIGGDAIEKEATMTMKTVEGRDGGQRDVHRQQQHCICDRLVLTHTHRQACKSRQTDRQTDRDTDGEKNERTTRRTTFLNSVALSHCTDVPCSRPVLFLGGPSKLVAISSHVLYILLFATSFICSSITSGRPPKTVEATRCYGRGKELPPAAVGAEDVQRRVERPRRVKRVKRVDTVS